MKPLEKSLKATSIHILGVLQYNRFIKNDDKGEKMEFTRKRNLVYQIIVTILSLISCGDLFFVLTKEIAQDSLIKGPHMSYIPLIIYASAFLVSAIISWFNRNRIIKVIQYILLVVLLFFTISSGLTAYPAELFIVENHAFYGFSAVLLPMTVILSFINLNLDSFVNNRNKALLFLLKFITTLFAVGVGFYLFLIISVAGNTFLMMTPTARNWALFGMFVWILINLIYAILIWFPLYRSWWAWLCSVILIIEIAVPVLYAYQEELWQGIIATLVVIALIGAMTYLNNKLVKEVKAN